MKYIRIHVYEYTERMFASNLSHRDRKPKYLRMYHRCFLTPACVCVEGLEVGFFPACSWLALVTGVGGYVWFRICYVFRLSVSMRKVASEHSFCVLIYMNSYIYHIYIISFIFF